MTHAHDLKIEHAKVRSYDSGEVEAEVWAACRDDDCTAYFEGVAQLERTDNE